jgi:DNA mismatch repair protein MutS
MMHQYKEIKSKHMTEILLFQLGDFYEMFFEDAITASRILEITLTSRESGSNRVPMCGIPVHAANNYIARLLDNGCRVAICEQVEEANQSRGLVKREVVKIITPGTIVDLGILDEKKNNYLTAIAGVNNSFGIAFCDISTGDFSATIIPLRRFDLLANELYRTKPKECLTIDLTIKEKDEISKLLKNVGIALAYWNDTITMEEAQSLISAWGVVSYDTHTPFSGYEAAAFAGGIVLKYLASTQKQLPKHLQKLSIYKIDSCMLLDHNALKNLEITETIRTGSKKGSLLDVLDFTKTAMGGRKLRQWLERPLLNCAEINCRLSLVQELVDNLYLRHNLGRLLNEIYDLERLIAKVTMASANARDMIALKNSIQQLPQIINLLRLDLNSKFNSFIHKIDPLDDIAFTIEAMLVEDPPNTIKEGNLIKSGYNLEVDNLRTAASKGKEWLLELELKEKNLSGIRSLKINYNKVFGYYFEVTKSNLANIPAYFQRKQTLANAERFITNELKELESHILGASERLVHLEYELFCCIREKVSSAAARVKQTAAAVAELDCLFSYAEAAVKNNYAMPQVNADKAIEIKEGRHPVVEKILSKQDFVPNDVLLDPIYNNILIITGPNMAGKSTFMRQTALIILMAQAGSFIPAQAASIGVVDRIFTRVGASDDLAAGQSTFMVEMTETAEILRWASSDSLILLDEIGRGTSTYDGISIAQAVLEYIHSHIRAKVLFSTHYHELTALADKLPGIRNYSMAIKEHGQDITFLRKVISGKASRSYGINVAKLSGLPLKLIQRASDILFLLESNEKEIAADCNNWENDKFTQPKFFSEEEDWKNKVLSDILSVEIASITPLEALCLLDRLQNKLKKGEEFDGYEVSYQTTGKGSS